jgi:glutamate N-acetyltransferase/amino-acid N-acetyltransferase
MTGSINAASVDRSLGVTAPAGFSAAGVGCGIKESGNPDLALVAAAGGTVAAGTFTTNLVVAAPVIWSRDRLAASPTARAVVLNAGNANACTGPDGQADAAAMASLTAAELGCRPDEVLVCSTGVIGVPLPMDRVAEGIRKAAGTLSPEGGPAAAEAILTTDTRTKQAGIRLESGVTFGAMAKGAAMLAPAMILADGPPHATMLAVVTTDAVAEPPTLRSALGSAVGESFNRITVDGSQSTNDTVLVLASGASGVTLPPGELRSALTAVCADLAGQMLGDAEGGTKVFTVTVRGAPDADSALAVARRVADSPLVKAAVHGGDPNWGRVLQAAGTAGVVFDPERARLTLTGPPGSGATPVLLVDGGVPTGADEAEAAALMGGDQCSFLLDLGGPGPAVSIHGCDLTPEYVHLNADYTT